MPESKVILSPTKTHIIVPIAEVQKGTRHVNRLIEQARAEDKKDKR